jgi:AcrR family transcriptional regulator
MNNTKLEAADRRRLHEAMLSELEEKGFERIELLHVLGAARIPEHNFEASYDSVEECIFAAYDEQAELLDSAVREACRGRGDGAPWPDRVSAGLEALLDALASRPQIARAVLRAFPTVGPRARGRSQAFTESFGPLLAGGRDAAEPGTELPREVEMLAAGAAEAIIFEEVESGRAEDLRTMFPSILFSVLVPFLGPSRAGEEMNKARRVS